MKSTLIIPTVSTGNIPQLSVDLLVTTLGAELKDRLDSQYLYPVVGPRDLLGRATLTTPAETYYSAEYNTTILQLRSPTLPGQRATFVEKTLVPYIASRAFEEVVVLGSTNRAFSPEVSESLRVLTTDLASSDIAEKFKRLSVSEKYSHELPDKLSESGILLDLMGQLKGKVSSLAFVIYAYEGDNFQEAEQLASQAAQWIGSSTTSWKRPESWDRVYGREVPIGLEEGLYS